LDKQNLTQQAYQSVCYNTI